MSDLPPPDTPLIDRRALVRIALLAATLLTIAYLFNQMGLTQLMAEHWMDAEVKGHGATGLLLFVAVSAGATAIGVPRQVPAFLAGYAFGAWQGTAIALAASLVGATGGYHYAHFMGRDWATRRFPRTADWLGTFLSGKAFITVLTLRLTPFSNNVVTNLAAGVAGVAFWDFFAASAIGYLPQTLAFALIGGGAVVDPALNAAMFAVLIVVSSALGVWLWRKSKKDRSNGG